MIDKYGLIYGISRRNKKNLKYIAYTTVFLILFNLIFTGGFELVYKYPENITEWVGLISTSYAFGIFTYFIYVYISSLKSIKEFQSKKKSLYIVESEKITREQLEVINKKAMVRSEILNILALENISVEREKKLKKIRNLMGGTREITAKKEFLQVVTHKATTKVELNEYEIEYLNELVLSEKDLELYKQVIEIFKDKKRKRQ